MDEYVITECRHQDHEAWPEVLKHWRIRNIDGKPIGGITLDRDGSLKAARSGYGYEPIHGYGVA